MKKYLRIHDNDLVAVALTNLQKGEEVLGVTLLEDIPQGHQFALQDIGAGEPVIQYNAPIGYAKERIPKGSWVHTHNVRTGLGENLEYTYTPAEKPVFPPRKAAFMGYRRADGRVGIRNEIWVLPTVGCVNDIVTRVEREAQALKTEGIDAILGFRHPYGCSQMGEDHQIFNKVFADLLHHPNAGGVLVLSLGCENSNLNALKPYIGEYDESRVKFLICQDVEDEVEEAMALMRELIAVVSQDRRTECDASDLIVGMKCGGSDGLSGITANPTIGAFSDKLVACGGTTILTEVPEMFGAETLLMNRAKDEEVFEKTVRMINGFNDYFRAHGQTIYENPSPGNKAGGITTLEDKALGCTQKSGSATVMDVLPYAGRVETKGLNLLYGPGNDLVAATALASSGAHLILFSTGRGTPWVTCVPTVKIASNSRLAAKKANWIDFNAGRLVEDKTLDELSEELFEQVLRIASGEETKSEHDGYHDLAVFKQGVTV
ncbi:MAG: altronate dehydratase [Lachnospiraceae bacterium]|nr:altronate dehydratase [Lachnospiraceae bacterium]